MFSTAVVVTTCNSPHTLRLVLLALMRQRIPPDEVLVADDGSKASTLAMLRELNEPLPFTLRHVWQPDEGFRLARSRNNAIHHTECDALAFLDQDVLPGREWLRAHLAALCAHSVCLGSVMDWSSWTACEKLEPFVREGRFEQMVETSQRQRLALRQRQALRQCWFRRLRVSKAHKPRLQGNNFCIFRSTLEAVNGFDETYEGWGQEDDDLARRLYAIGVKPLPVHDTALAYHLAHETRRPQRWRDGPNAARFRARGWTAVCRAGLMRSRRGVRVKELYHVTHAAGSGEPDA